MPLKFRNNLNDPVDVYFSYYQNNRSHRRKALRDNNGNPTSSIGNETKLQIDQTGLPKEFKLEIEMEFLPVYKGKEAIKIVPGSGLGDAHHMELHLEKREQKTIKTFIVHYEKTGNKFMDIDPEIIHPDKP